MPDTHIVNCETGEVSVIPMTDEEVAALEQAQAEQQALQDAAAVALAQHKAATVADMVAAFRPLAADPAMQGAAAYMLKMALGVASGMGIDVQPGDLPADLQAALAALPSGA